MTLYKVWLGLVRFGDFQLLSDSIIFVIKKIIIIIIKEENDLKYIFGNLFHR